jgi:AhpD family alkylhydroperoxidase
MDRRDPFPRRTATPLGLLPWLGEIVLRAPGLLASYTRPNTLDARTRERVILAVTEVNGCRYCAWIHGNWADFLGEGAGRVDAEEAVLAYARACAEAGAPLDPAPLAERGLPAASIRAIQATVAQIEVSNLVGNTVDGLLARVTRKRPLDPLAAVQELAVIGAAVPLAIPMLAVGAGLKAIERLAPKLPAITMPPAGEANLLVHLLASAIPTYLANAAVRIGVLGMPAEIAVGLKAGRTTATVRVGRSKVAVENGLSHDVVFVVEGEVEPLLKIASGDVIGELRKLRLRSP